MFGALVKWSITLHCHCGIMVSITIRPAKILLMPGRLVGRTGTFEVPETGSNPVPASRFVRLERGVTVLHK